MVLDDAFGIIRNASMGFLSMLLGRVLFLVRIGSGFRN